MIFLRKGGLTTNCASHLIIYYLTPMLIVWSYIVSLASNFSILLGRIVVEVPHVETGSDYQVVCEFFGLFFFTKLITVASIWRLRKLLSLLHHREHLTNPTPSLPLLNIRFHLQQTLNRRWTTT